MNAKSIAVIALGIVALGGFVFVITRSKTPSVAPVSQTVQEVTTQRPVEITSGKRYVPYSKAAFDQAANKKRILYFHANWCPICRPIDAEFSANMDKIPENIVVIRVNYNDSDTDAEEKDLARRYSVTYQHTFVQIDTQGNTIAVWNGGGLTELLTNSK